MSRRILIDAPVADVFQYAADCRNDVHWRRGVVSLKISGGDPFAEGLQMREVLQAYGRKVTTTGELTSIEPNKRTFVRSLSGPIPIEVERLFQVEGDQTAITFRMKGELNRFFSLIWPFIGGTGNLERQVDESLAKLKQVVEGQRP